MKRVFSYILLTVLLLGVLPVEGYATQMNRETIYYEDGSYLVIEILESVTRASGTKTGKKQYTYYDDNDESQWKAVLSGTFTYTGSSATCTASNVDVTVYDSAWYVSSKYASKSGNTAAASVTMGHKVAGITITKVPVSLTLTCDANGNLS